MVCYHQNIHQDIGLMAFGPTRAGPPEICRRSSTRKARDNPAPSSTRRPGTDPARPAAPVSPSCFHGKGLHVKIGKTGQLKPYLNWWLKCWDGRRQGKWLKRKSQWVVRQDHLSYYALKRKSKLEFFLYKNRQVLQVSRKEPTTSHDTSKSAKNHERYIVSHAITLNCT